MSKIDLLLVAAFISGLLLFLYGANIYNAVVGYSGIYLCIGAVATYIIIYIYKELKKRESCEVPAPAPEPASPQTQV
ncbi:MAG: hypothetical protein ACM3UY_01030 [Methanocella sp.]|jgi:hypothetical protein